MASSFASTINSLYLAYYGRPADPAGLDYWTQQLEHANGDFGGIINAFATSDEATARFQSTGTADQITQIYQQLFNRAPDAAGLAYWVGLVDKGSVTLANAAADILQGARATDLQLSTLRQQVADNFTAQVRSGGTDYSGYASIEAARVLVKAVTLDMSAADLQSVTKAAVTLADIATKTPAVVDAIATGTTLTALLDTARGAADPVGLVQTLANVAEAAAGSPATLDSLLRGGGMQKVLTVMPSSATLPDVVHALEQGGLPAAVDVVYPSTPSTSLPTPTVDVTPPAPGVLSFHGLDDTGPGAAAGLTNGNGFTLSLTGAEQGATVKYEVAQGDSGQWTTVSSTEGLDNGSYHYRALVTDAAGNVSTSNVIDVTIDKTVPVITGFALGENDGQLAIGESVSFSVTFSKAVDVHGIPEVALNNGGTATYTSGTGSDTLVFTYTPQAGQSIDSLATAIEHAFDGRITDEAGNAVATTTFDDLHPAEPLLVDGVAPDVGSISYSQVTQGPNDIKLDNVTNVTLANVDFVYTGNDLGSGETFQYSLDGVNWSSANVDVYTSTNTVRIKGIDLSHGVFDGANLDTTVSLRAVDAAGNATGVVSKTIVYDNHADAPQVSLAIDSAGPNGTGSDAITNNGALTLNGVETGAKVEYSADGAGNWSATAPTAVEGGNSFYVRQTDKAGNVSDAAHVGFQLDTHAPAAPHLTLASDTGASATDGITSSGLVNLGNLEGDGAAWQWSLDGGGHWTTGQNGSTQLDLTAAGDGAKDLLVRQVDVAGNASEAASLHFTLDTSAPTSATLSFSAVEQATTDANVTELTNARVYFKYDGALDSDAAVQWRLADGDWTNVNSASIDTDTHTIMLGPIDLSSSDPTVEMRIVDAAGNQSSTVSQLIDGPHQPAPLDFETEQWIDGAIVISSAPGSYYMVDANGVPHSQLPLQGSVEDTLDGPQLVLGVQQEASSGFIEVKAGNQSSIDTHISYGLGTNNADELSGSTLYGYGGNDHMVAQLSPIEDEGQVIMVGGAGDDTMTGSHGSTMYQLDVGSGTDTITNFAPGLDELDVENPFSDAPALQNHGIGRSTTLYQSLDQFISDVNAHNQVSDDVTGVTIGQVGQDTYVLVDNDGQFGTLTEGSDSIVKLNGVSVRDVDWHSIYPANEVAPHEWGDGSIDGTPAGGTSSGGTDTGTDTGTDPGAGGTSDGGELTPVPESSVVSASYRLDDGIIYLNSGPGVISGFSNSNTFSLVDMHNGGQTVGQEVYVSTGALSTFDPLGVSLYHMSWQGDTFASDIGGNVAAGELYFAGGVNASSASGGALIVGGFTVNGPTLVDGMQYSSANEVGSNDALLVDNGIAAIVHTGGGNDVVSIETCPVTLSYDAADSSASDLVLGFRSGLDSVQLGDALATPVDADHNGTITWLSAGNSTVAPGSTTEGVEISMSQSVLMGNLGYEASMLSGQIDMSGTTLGQSMLILVNGGDQGALYLYHNIDGNSTIDASELTEIAVFSGGAPHGADIVLVGTAISNVPGGAGDGGVP